MSYYETVPVDSRERIKYELHNKSQDEIALAMFQHSPQGLFASEDLETLGMLKSSAVRTINTLCNNGRIEYAGHRQGKFGRPIKLYKLKFPQSLFDGVK